MRSRIIDKEQAGEIDRWDVPSVDATAADALRGAQKVGAHLLTAGQLDALQKQVHDEAFKRGFDEGLAAGKAELASRVARISALAESFSQPFQNLERSVEEELVNLSVELASHLVRHEIAHDPALLARRDQRLPRRAREHGPRDHAPPASRRRDPHSRRDPGGHRDAFCTRRRSRASARRSSHHERQRPGRRSSLGALRRDHRRGPGRVRSRPLHAAFEYLARDTLRNHPWGSTAHIPVRRRSRARHSKSTRKGRHLVDGGSCV